MKRNLPLAIISVISAAVIVIYLIGVRYGSGPKSAFNSQETAETPRQNATSSATSSSSAPNTIQPGQTKPRLQTSLAFIIRDDLARFWIVWQGRKYLLSPVAMPQEKANLIETVDATRRSLSAISCSQAPQDQVVLVNFDLYLIKETSTTFKYKLAYRQVTGNYAGSLPTTQGCLLPQQ